MSRKTRERDIVAAAVVAAQIAQVTPTISPDARARLGEVLLAHNILLPEQLTGALNLQLESGRQLGSILVEQGLLDPERSTRPWQRSSVYRPSIFAACARLRKHSPSSVRRWPDVSESCRFN